MTEQTHITQCDDPRYLPFAETRIKVLRATGLKYASQKFEIEGVQIKVRVEGEHSFVSITGGTFPLAMDSGIIDVGSVISSGDHEERFWAGKRKYIPAYEGSFTDRVGTTPWYLNPAESNTGQLAGIVSVGKMLTGKVRKDDVAESFVRQTTGTDENGERVANEADETLLAKKRSGVYCPASMFTGRTRLYVQAMYGQPLYKKQTGDKADVAIPTPQASYRNGWPYLALIPYNDPDTKRRKAFKDKVDADRAAHVESGSLLPFDDPYIVSLTTNSGVYFDPVSRQHWLINPGYGYVTIYPLKASSAGERARKWLKEGKLIPEESERMETYILSTCKPHVEVAQTLTITAIVPWASGYGWHWNWSGTTADMVRVTGAAGYGDGSMESAHYQLTTTAVFDPDTRTTSWSASAVAVGGTVRFMMQTPVCCVTHPNWTNRYVGEDLDHAPSFWSEKLAMNHDPRYGADFSFGDAPLYAFYKKDELQLVTLSLAIGAATPPRMDSSPYYVTMLGTGPIDYTLVGASIGNDAAFLRVWFETSKPYNYTLTCGNDIVRVKRGEHEQGHYVQDSAKTEIAGPLPLSSSPFNPPGVIQLRSGRPRNDGSYSQTFIYAPEGATAYPASTQYGVSEFTSSSGGFDKQWYGTCGGIIPFYDAEAFYMVQDTWGEFIESNRKSHTVAGSYTAFDGGMMLTPVEGVGYSVSYYGWSKLELLSGGSGSYDYLTEADSFATLSPVTTMVAVTSNGTATAPAPHPATYGMFEDGHSNYVGETFNTISSAGNEKLFRGLIEINWPDLYSSQNPVIVGWV